MYILYYVYHNFIYKYQYYYLYKKNLYIKNKLRFINKIEILLVNF